jgi:hypothetical protein
MAQGVGKAAPLRFSRAHRISTTITCLAVFAAALFSGRHLHAQDEQLPVDDITAKYHFLSPEDTLAILDEEGKLKGYIEVAQPEDESDDILSYDILEGSCKKNHVEFHTNRIHGKSFRFSGTVDRGKGHEEKDPDYLHLTGSLDIVTVNGDTGKEAVRTVRVFFKSIGKAERPED